MKKIFKNFTLIDGNGTEPVVNAFMVLDGEKIENIGTGECNIEGKVIDLEGKTVMPGLINAHIHSTIEPFEDTFSKDTPAQIAFKAARNMKMHLDMGTTFVRDVGGKYFVDIDLRDAINSKIVEGAQMLVAGKNLAMTGGHGWEMGREVDGIDEARKGAREQLRAGADLIKLMATGGVMTKGVEPGSPQMEEDEMRAAIEEAHKVGAKTATHAQGNTGIKNALRAGIDTVEHAIFLDDEAIQMMLDNGTWVVPTLSAVYFIVRNSDTGKIPEYAVRKAKQVQETHIESIKKAYKAGVKICNGTDSGTPYNYHGSAPYEAILLMEIGMSPMEALVASTKSSAECLGIDKEYGTLEVGKFADFLILKENPLENMNTLFDIEDVYKLGEKVQRKFENPQKEEFK